jgi:hypothetical protein
MAIPLVLGGIACTAIGYGIRMMVEDKCYSTTAELPQSRPKDKKQSKPLALPYKQTIENISEYKLSIYRDSLSEFVDIYDEIENTPLLPIKYNEEAIKEESIDTSKLDSKSSNLIESYKDILYILNNILEELNSDIEPLVEASLDYSKYTNTQKDTIKLSYDIAKSIHKMCIKNILNQNSINKKSEKEIEKAILLIERFNHYYPT